MKTNKRIKFSIFYKALQDQPENTITYILRVIDKEIINASEIVDNELSEENYYDLKDKYDHLSDNDYLSVWQHITDSDAFKKIEKDLIYKEKLRSGNEIVLLTQPTIKSLDAFYNKFCKIVGNKHAPINKKINGAFKVTPSRLIDPTTGNLSVIAMSREDFEKSNFNYAEQLNLIFTKKLQKTDILTYDSRTDLYDYDYIGEMFTVDSATFIINPDDLSTLASILYSGNITNQFLFDQIQKMTQKNDDDLRE